MTEKRKLFLYEALELRGEYDGRIKTLKETLPETRKNRDRFSLARRDDERHRPSPKFDPAQVRTELRALEHKRRKLNNAIQQANFSHSIDFGGDSINLNEALEARKALNEQIGELHTQVVDSAYQRIIYKEGRDIVEESELSYSECETELHEARLAFRELNRKLRLASFEAKVDFLDD